MKNYNRNVDIHPFPSEEFFPLRFLLNFNYRQKARVTLRTCLAALTTNKINSYLLVFKPARTVLFLHFSKTLCLCAFVSL